MKIAIYGICLNEEAFVARFMDLGAQIQAIRIVPWRFDHARNAALDLVPDDVDVCVSLDLDTVLRPGWRAALEAAWAPGINRARYAEIVGRTPDGAPRLF